HATIALGLSPADCPATTYEVLHGTLPIHEAIQQNHFPGLDVLPSSVPLAAAEQFLSGLPGRERRLLESLQGIPKRYDYVVVDSPPSLGLLTFNALRAADEAIVPIDPSFLSIHGLGRLMEMVELLRHEGRHALSLKALLVMFDFRTRFAHEVLRHLESELTARYETSIRPTVRLREAAACGKPVISHAPNSIGAEDFEHLAHEVMAEEPSAIREFPVGKEPLQTAEGVFFWRPRSDGKEVTLAGDFNEWVPDRKIGSIPCVRSRSSRRWHMSSENGRKGVQLIGSYFLSVIPPPRIGLLRLGPSLHRAGTAIAASLEREGKRILLLSSDYQRDGAEVIAVRPEGFREGPLAEWKTCSDQLRREERASDLLLFLLHPDIPSLPRLLPLLNLLILLLPWERGEAIGAYRLAKRVLIQRRDLPVG